MSEIETAATLREDILSLVRQYSKVAHRIPDFIPGQSPVPVSGKWFDDSDVSLVVESALDFRLTGENYGAIFEDKISSYLGIRYFLCVNSGSSANLAATAALFSPLLKEKALQPGDEFITVAAGFPATITPALQYGLVPIFVDVDLQTLNIQAERIEECITPRTRAIILAHTLGNPFDLDVVTRIAKEHDLWLIEDCCDALGSTWKDQLVGSFGDFGTLSFYPAHHITMGEGGGVFTNNNLLFRIARSMRDWGRDCWCLPGHDNTCNKRFGWSLGNLPQGYDHKYIYSHAGYNLKISDMQAATGVAQMGHLDHFVDSRRQNFDFLYRNLQDLEEFLILPRATPYSDPCWFGFPITLRTGTPGSRIDLIQWLEEGKIATRLLFGGNLICQPFMQQYKYKVVGELPNTNKIMNDTFWIGVWPGLTRQMLEYVVDRIRKYFSTQRNA
jgi:CDP-6-deoxy-D-xylo-4-hexulose-3-dehydrase